MPDRDHFLRLIWDEVINPPMRGAWMDNMIAASQKDSQGPFADTGEAIQRLLALGADRRDLSMISRWAAYEAVFSTLYMLDDPGVDGGNVPVLHETLLAADPSGKEGDRDRPHDESPPLVVLVTDDAVRGDEPISETIVFPIAPNDAQMARLEEIRRVFPECSFEWWIEPAGPIRRTESLIEPH